MHDNLSHNTDNHAYVNKGSWQAEEAYLRPVHKGLLANLLNDNPRYVKVDGKLMTEGNIIRATEQLLTDVRAGFAAHDMPYGNP